ncbi:hypothetical protein Tco_0327021 [Tanacetum coccineum]
MGLWYSKDTGMSLTAYVDADHAECQDTRRSTSGSAQFLVTLDALKLSPCYPAFLITVEVREVYMHQFWTTIQKVKDTDAYRFKLDKKKFRVDTKIFDEILQICPKNLNQDFIAPPSEEELVTFI